MSGPSRREAIALAAGALSALSATRAAAQEQDTQDPDASMASSVGGSPEDAEARQLSEATFAEAERLVDVRYTDEERRQMLEGVDSWIDRLRRLRAVEKPNALAPALTFDPRLPDADYPVQPDGFTGSGQNAGPLPGRAEDIAFAPAWRLSQWIQSGALSSAALTEIYLERIGRHAPRLQNFVTVTADIARRQAEEADRELAQGQSRGPLHGLPYGLKDLADVKGVISSWGAEPYKDQVATVDSNIYHKLRQAGAVLLGKTTLGALAYGDIWFGGVTKNPWKPEEGSSGSSAGSASATAAGLCAFSIGTETLGSIVSPSERCGTTGLRPTFGRIGRSGAMALCWSLDKIGPITRNVEDAAMVMAAINGRDGLDPSSIDMGMSIDLAADQAGLRVGYDPAWFEAGSDADRYALAAAMQLGWEMVEISIPERPYDALFAQLEAEAAAAFEDMTLSDQDDRLTWQEPNAWPNTFRRARFISAIDMIQVDRLRRLVMQEMDQMFEGIDLILGPNFAGSLLTITNYTGHPQLTLRSGLRRRRLAGSDEGAPEYDMPTNISLWGGLFEEGRLLAAGRRLEQALGAHSERPNL